MKKWDGKSKGPVWGYKVFILIIKRNINSAYALLRVVTLFYYFFSSKKNSSFYFRKIHHYNWYKTQKSIYKNYCLLGEMIIDRIAVLENKKHSFSFELEGEDLLKKISADGKGGLLVGAHMGNWEIAGHLFKRVDIPINIVMLDADHKKIKEVLGHPLAQGQINVIPIKDDFSYLIKMKEAFARKEFVVMHGDRFIDESTSVTVPFMGEAAKFPIGPAYLALSNQVPLVYVYTLKEGKSHYHFYAREATVPSTFSDRSKRREIMSNLTINYASELEKMVIKYPLQWFNYYDFWEKEKDTYKDTK